MDVVQKLRYQKHWLEDAADEIDRLRTEVERETARADAMERAGAEQARRADENLEAIRNLRAENERLLGIIASIKAYCDKSKWRMRGRGAPTLQGQDMAYTHVLNHIDQLERNAALAAGGE